MQEKEKQIEEMAKTIYEQDLSYDTYYQTHCERLATDLYNAGYRKSTDLAEEIFAEIEEMVITEKSNDGCALYLDKVELAELKKKYTQEK